MNYVIHDDDGKIRSYHSSSVKPETLIALGRQFVQYDPNVVTPRQGTHYVSAGKIIERADHGISIDKTTVTADGEDVAAITGIPVGSEVRVDGAAQRADDGTLELGADHPCRRHVWIVPPFPAREFRATVVAE